MAHFIALAEVRKQCSLPGNPRNRLVKITDAERTTALYGHNYKGQRVTKAMGQRAQHFIYNQFDQLIAEANDQGVIEKEYVYLGLTPIAHIQVADEAVYYHHNDHLGSVQAISDAQQNILWRAHYKPFGAIEQVEGQGENNWRFPGQYADQESGYYYNYFRDYDPSLGRYIQSDPIGLAGGVNTFGYVLGNPLNNVDILGLDVFQMSSVFNLGWAGYGTTATSNIAFDNSQVMSSTTTGDGGFWGGAAADYGVQFSYFPGMDEVGDTLGVFHEMELAFGPKNLSIAGLGIDLSFTIFLDPITGNPIGGAADIFGSLGIFNVAYTGLETNTVETGRADLFGGGRKRHSEFLTCPVNK